MSGHRPPSGQRLPDAPGDNRLALARGLAIGTLVGVVTGWTGTAAAQGRLSANASLSAGVATNPYQQVGPTPTAASATVELAPEYAIETALTKLRLLGDVRVTGYSADYPVNDSYSLRGSGEHRVSPTTRINADLGYVNSVVGSFNDVVVPVAVTDPSTGLPSSGLPSSGLPGIGLPTAVDDPVLAGIGRRRSAFSVLGGVSVTLSQFDEIAARASAGATRYPDRTLLDEFNSAGAGVSYRRLLSEGFTAGLNADVTRVNYLGNRVGDSTIYQPSVTLTRVLDSRWTLSGSAGVALVRIAAPGGTRASTEFNGSLGICRRDSRWNACLTANRTSLPSAVQGVRTQTGIAGTLGYRVSERDELSATAGYSRANTPLLRAGRATVGAVDFTNASASYARRIGARVSGFASASASKSDDDFLNREANIEGRLGIRYRLGGRQ